MALFVFFGILPFAQRLKIGKILEFEAKVNRVQEEIREVRSETLQLVSTVSSMVNTVSSSVNQNIIFNLSREEAERVHEDFSKEFGDPPEPEAKQRKVQQLLDASESDVSYALARLRMNLEIQLRRILGKRLSIDDPSSMEGKFLGARSLFRRLLAVDDRYKNMEQSFNYVLKVCNAAIHGQRIESNIADEALYMGLRMVEELEKQEEIKV